MVKSIKQRMVKMETIILGVHVIYLPDGNMIVGGIDINALIKK